MKRALVPAGIVVILIGAGLLWWTSRITGGGARGRLLARRSGSHRAVRSRATCGDAGAERRHPAGTLRLEGMVVGPDDHPVAGATVVLAANPIRTAITEADGGFSFDRLVGRTYTLVARAPAGVAGPAAVHLTDRSDPVVLKLRPGARLTVTVAGPDGKPFDHANVELRGTDVQAAMTEAGKVMFAPVVPGMYDVVAWAPGLAKTVRTLRIAGEVSLRLTLVPGGPASGRVVDEHGAPVAGASVVYVASGELRPQADTRLDAVVTGADGAWRFPALPAGSFRFLASHPDHAPGTSTLARSRPRPITISSSGSPARVPVARRS